MINLRENLLYADLSGRQRLRRYVVAVLAIAVLLGAVFSWEYFLQPGLDQPAVGEAASIEPQTVETGLALQAPPSPVVSAAPAGGEGCPEDPEMWQFVEAFVGENYRRIEPACVYAGLERTVAWHMLERLGHSKQEAARQLGFEVLPWRPVAEIAGLTGTGGPQTLKLTMEWAPHPDYAQWDVDPAGEAGIAYSLRGCYRTRSITGGQADNWGAYPVQCLVAMDLVPGASVHILGDQRFTFTWEDQLALRAFLIFAYSPEAGWVLVGELQDQRVSLEASLDLESERLLVAGRFGAASWEAGWLMKRFGVGMRPLPQGWGDFGIPTEAVQAIGAALDIAWEEFQP